MVADNLRKIREYFNVSQVQLGSNVSVSRDSISHVETGNAKTFPIKLVETLHIKYGIDLNWLFCDDGKMFYKDNPDKTSNKISNIKKSNINAGVSNSTISTGDTGEIQKLKTENEYLQRRILDLEKDKESLMGLLGKR